MSTRIMRVHEVRLPRAYEGAQSTSCHNVPVGAHADRGRCGARATQSLDQRRVRICGDERLVTRFALAAGEQEHLPLSPAPLTP